jgi:VanZ family protein
MIARLVWIADSLSARPWPLRWLPAASLAAAIWWLSSQSRIDTGLELGWWGVLLANSAHGVVFGALAALVHVALTLPGRRRFLMAVVLASIYGAADEFHQSFVPGRSPSVLDWWSDTTGAVVGAGVATWARDSASWALRLAVFGVPLAILSALLESL